MSILTLHSLRDADRGDPTPATLRGAYDSLLS
jgi:hypothetical protein